MPSIQSKAAAIAEKGGYSEDRYANWTSVAKALLKHFDEREVEAIMQSKWARWAADAHAGDYRYGQFPAKVLVEFAVKQGVPAVQALTKEHFND